MVNKVNKEVCLVIGTRPEAIKMYPIIEILRNHSWLRPYVISTGQHGEILTQTLADLQVKPDFHLNIMTHDQALPELNARLLMGMSEVIASRDPSIILVQGDTSSAFAGALASFLHKKPVAHVEAGLRSSCLAEPFPEEGNRRLISPIADLHFSPTQDAVNALIRESIQPDQVFLTGNTSVDALRVMQRRILLGEKKIPHETILLANSRNLILVTCHRRESFGEPLRRVCAAIQEISKLRPDATIVFPIHPNPNVEQVVKMLLSNLPNVRLLAPLVYSQFVLLMSRAHVIITDSGGVQEEAPTLGKRTIVIRNDTERSEAVLAGYAQIVGTDTQEIVHETLKELDSDFNLTFKKPNRIFGDGNAAEKIIKSLEDFLALKDSS